MADPHARLAWPRSRDAGAIGAYEVAMREDVVKQGAASEPGSRERPSRCLASGGAPRSVAPLPPPGRSHEVLEGRPCGRSCAPGTSFRTVPMSRKRAIRRVDAQALRASSADQYQTRPGPTSSSEPLFLNRSNARDQEKTGSARRLRVEVWFARQLS